MRSTPRSNDITARRPPRSCCSPTASRCAAATRSRPPAAKARKIPIYTVALGTAKGTINDGEPVPPDPQTLAKIAQLTGGKAFTAGDTKELGQVYKRLGSQVATERRSARSRTSSPAARWR